VFSPQVFWVNFFSGEPFIVGEIPDQAIPIHEEIS
jgi:hypothetical protein